MPEFYDAKKVKQYIAAFSSLLEHLENVAGERLLTAPSGNKDEAVTLRDQIEQALKTLRLGVDHYVNFLQTTHDGLWVLNQDFTTKFVNQQACEMIGRREDEIIGHSAFEFACENRLDSLKAQFQLRRAGEAGIYEHCLRHADGSEVWVIVSATPLLTSNNQFNGTLALLRNITPFRRAEDALRLSENRMRILLESLHDLVWSTSPDFREVYYLSPATQNVYGRPPRDFLENHLLWREIIYPDDYEMVRAATSGMEVNHRFECEYRVIWPDQSVHWIFARAWMITDDTGKPIRADGIVQNITARKHAEFEAAETRSQLHETLEAMPDSFHVLDHELRFVYANPGAVKLFGRPVEELLHQRVYELYPPTADLDYPALMWEALKSGKTLQYDTYYEPFGVWLEVRAHPVPQGLAVYARDITAEKEALRHKDAILDGMASQIALLDEHANIIEVNKAWADYTERNGLPGGGVGLNYLQLLEMAGMMADDLPAKLQGVMSGTLPRYVREHRCLHGGRETWWRFTGTPAPRAAGFGGAVVVHTDITEGKIVEAALAKSEERYALAAEGANDGLFDWDLANQHLYLSPRWKEIIGYQPDELTTDREEWLGRIHPDDRERVQLDIWRSRAHERPKIHTEFRIRRKDNKFFWVLCRAIINFGPDDRPSRMVGSISDITERKNYEDRLAHNAMHDPLTSLPNRLLLTERLQRAMGRFARTNGPHYAVLFLDLDNFKHVNDSLGHQVGDQLLIEVGRRLRECIRPQDSVARLGGDEFAVLLEEISGDSAAIIAAQRIQAALESPFNAGTRPIGVTASIGVLIGSPGHSSPVEVLRDADTAMYKAKAAGRNAYAIFDAKMHHAAMARLEMENDLYKAIEQQQLVLHFQPIVSIKSGTLCGFEALVRWNHPEKGLIPPHEFIPLAEETGQIIAIGEWIALEACRTFKKWQDHFPILKANGARISINVSARQFAFAGFSDRIAHIVQSGGLCPSDVNLELTESALLKNPAGSESILASLRSIGFKIHLDDFGTGFSSLTHLQLPIDSVKIDRRFVSHICSSHRDRELVRGIINLAAALNLGVVAEGVETCEQARELQKLHCKMAQGYFYSKPVPEQQAVEVLKSFEV